MNGVFDETKCTKGASIKAQWSAEEARLVKRILNNISVRQWDHSYTEIEREPSGDWIIWIPYGAASSATAAYASYFKLYDASTTGACKIGVKDGSVVGAMPSYCGIGWVNGEEISVANFEEEVSASGSAWLQAYLNESGVGLRIVTTSGASPEGDEGDILYQNRLIGRWSFAEDAITATNQDYLQGGECSFTLLEPC